MEIDCNDTHSNLKNNEVETFIVRKGLGMEWTEFGCLTFTTNNPCLGDQNDINIEYVS